MEVYISDIKFISEANIFLSKTLRNFHGSIPILFSTGMHVLGGNIQIHSSSLRLILLVRSWKQFHLPLKTSDAYLMLITHLYGHHSDTLVKFILYFWQNWNLIKIARKREKTSLKYHHKIFISLTCLNICILNVN